MIGFVRLFISFPKRCVFIFLFICFVKASAPSYFSSSRCCRSYQTVLELIQTADSFCVYSFPSEHGGIIRKTIEFSWWFEVKLVFFCQHLPRCCRFQMVDCVVVAYLINVVAQTSQTSESLINRTHHECMRRAFSDGDCMATNHWRAYPLNGTITVKFCAVWLHHLGGKRFVAMANNYDSIPTNEFTAE